MDLAVDERLTSGEGHHRCPALLHRVDALLDRQSPGQDVVRVLDLAATGAGEVALIERFELQHQRELLDASNALLHDVEAYGQLLSQWYAHCLTSSPLSGQRHRREDVPVQVIVDVEVPREAGAGVLRFVPGPVYLTLA